MGFPGGSDGKESTCNEGDRGLIPELGRSSEGGHGNPLQYSCLENPHEQRSLAGSSPWGCRVRHGWVTKHSVRSVIPSISLLKSRSYFPQLYSSSVSPILQKFSNMDNNNNLKVTNEIKPASAFKTLECNLSELVGVNAFKAALWFLC